MDLSKAKEQREAQKRGQSLKQEAKEAEQGKVIMELNWPDDYYASQDPEKRKIMLDQAIAQKLAPKEDEIRRILWNKRYNGRPGVDEFLACYIDLQFFAKSVTSDRGLRWHKKEYKRVLDMLGQELVDQYGEMGAELVYLEIYHTIERYIDSCATDKRYSTMILGLGHLKDEQIIRKIALELYGICNNVAPAITESEEFKRFRQAARDCFCAKYPEYADSFDYMMENNGVFAI